jgi:hypothetical protein
VVRRLQAAGVVAWWRPAGGGAVMNDHDEAVPRIERTWVPLADDLDDSFEEWIERVAGPQGPAAFVQELRRRAADAEAELARLRGSESSTPVPFGGSGVAGELRRLRLEVERLRQTLPPLLGSVEQAAELAGVSVRTMRSRIRAGDVPTRRVGRRVLVDLAGLRGADAEELAHLAREARQGGA